MLDQGWQIYAKQKEVFASIKTACYEGISLDITSEKFYFLFSISFCNTFANGKCRSDGRWCKNK